jgi:hypothetical protein
VLIVTRGGTSTREAAKKGREMLEKVGARICGVAVWGLEEGAGGRGYGYYYDGYYGGYYGSYYSEYYSRGVETPQSAGKHKRRGAPDSGAQATVKVVPERMEAEADLLIAQPSMGQRAAAGIGRVMAGVVAFVLVVALMAVVVYLLDQYFGWGLLGIVGSGL